MAESLASLRMGDSKAFFKFDQEPGKDVTCPICFEPWQHPVELQPCGHIFCESCLPQRTEGRIQCPMCRKNARTMTQPNRALMNLVAGLPTSCTRCEWQGEYSQFQLHDCPAGNEHRLPRHESRNMAKARTAFNISHNTRAAPTVRTTEETPLVVVDMTTQEEAPPSSLQRFEQWFSEYGKRAIVAFLMLIGIIAIVVVFEKNSRHSSPDEHSPTPTPAPPTPSPTTPAQLLQCDSLECSRQPSSCNPKTTAYPASMFECTSDSSGSNDRCEPTTYIKDCKSICNRVTCEPGWESCSEEACREFQQYPLCSKEKPFRCYAGDAKGTCSDAPDISYCGAICNVKSCI